MDFNRTTANMDYWVVDKYVERRGLWLLLVEDNDDGMNLRVNEKGKRSKSEIAKDTANAI